MIDGVAGGIATGRPEREEEIKGYLAKEAVPVLTKALTELCLEKNPPPPGETVSWLIAWLQKQQ